MSGRRNRARASSRRPNEHRHTSLTWEAGWLPLSDTPAAAVLPPDAGALLVVESESGLVVVVEMLEQYDIEQVSERILAKFVESPGPARPAQLRVHDPLLAQVLQHVMRDTRTQVNTAAFEFWDVAARDLSRHLNKGSFTQHHEPLQESPAMAAFFRAAAAYYKAKPWTVLTDEHPMQIDLPEEKKSYYALALGAGDITHGLVVFDSLEGIDGTRQIARKDDIDRMPPSIAVTFAPEREVPEPWRKQRRRNGWPIAGRDAFPLAIGHQSGEVVELNSDQLWQLAQAATAVEEFVSQHGAKLRAFEAAESVLRVPGPSGATSVRVSFPISQLIDDAIRDRDEDSELLNEMRARVLEHSGANRDLDRLAWSFFLADSPGYEDNEPAAFAAFVRFNEWAAFVARPHGKTLAERVLDAEQGWTEPERSARRAISAPRIGIFQVLEALPDHRLCVRDVANDTEFFLRQTLELGVLPVGSALAGALHLTVHGDYIAGLGALHMSELSDHEDLLITDAAELAPLLEQIAAGADTEWIQELSLDEVRAAYDDFRRAISGAGGHLPTFRQLRKSVWRNKEPQDLLDWIGQSFEPWTSAEVDLLLSLVSRTWDLVRGEGPADTGEPDLFSERARL